MSFKIPDYLLTNDREDFKDDPRDVPHYYEQRHENKLNGFIAGLGTGLLNTFTASIVDTATRKSIQILDTIKGEDLISPEEVEKDYGFTVSKPVSKKSVSYTHLTLPTICSV